MISYIEWKDFIDFSIGVILFNLLLSIDNVHLTLGNVGCNLGVIFFSGLLLWLSDSWIWGLYFILFSVKYIAEMFVFYPSF